MFSEIEKKKDIIHKKITKPYFHINFKYTFMIYKPAIFSHFNLLRLD